MSGLRYVELDGKWRLMPEKLKTQAIRQYGNHAA